MTKLRWLLLLFACFAFTATAAAKTTRYFPTGRTCRVGYSRKTIRVAERKHGRMVRRRRVECVAKSTTTTSTSTTNTANTPSVAATPTISYSSSVDPSITQNPSNPLQVTISYSASATSTENGIVTNLATTGDLPVGVLNLYSTNGGAGSDLICSMNVGNSTSGGTCNVTYPQIGSYFLTTQYITSATSSVTSTESITVEPMPDTATITLGDVTTFSNIGCAYSLGPQGPCDESGDAGYVIDTPISATDPNAEFATTLTDVTTGQTFTFTGAGSVMVETAHWYNGTQSVPSGDVEISPGNYVSATDVITMSVEALADYADGFQPSGPSNTVQLWPVS